MNGHIIWIASTRLKLPLPVPNGVGLGTTGKREAKEGLPVEEIVNNYSMSVSWKGDGKKVFVNAMRVRCICFNYKI